MKNPAKDRMKRGALKTRVVTKPRQKKRKVLPAIETKAPPLPAVIREHAPLVQVESQGALVSVNPEALIARAIDKGLPLESIERLLAMRRELKTEWAKERFFAALSRFQKACPIIVKTSEVKGKDGKLRYKYAPLDEIVAAAKDPLEANGFSYTVQTKQTETAVTSICHLHHVDGHTESSEFTIPMDPEAYMNDSQKIASAMSYSKRYSLCNVTGIMTGDPDDDAIKTEDDTPPRVAPRKSMIEPQEKKGSPNVISGAFVVETIKPTEADLNTLRAELNEAFHDVQTSKYFDKAELTSMMVWGTAAKDDPAKMRELMKAWRIETETRAEKALNAIASKAFPEEEKK